MRAEYTAKCTGLDPFPALLAAAYGLDRPTADEVLCDGDVICRPRPKLLPTGAGRDQQLGAMAEKIREKAGTPRQTHQWAVRGKFTFDGSPCQARWLKAYALPHAASYWVILSIPALKGWMAEGGEEQIARYEERLERRSMPVRQRRNDDRPYEICTTIRRSPVLDMLTRGAYPDRYCPRTDAEELRGVLVAQTGGAYIAIGRGFDPPRHGHKAWLRVDSTNWMSTAPKERLYAAQAARLCRPGSDTFVGGLGLGLVILWLARRCRSITVAEIDERVIRLVWPRLRDYVGRRHPDTGMRVLWADAADAAGRERGRYDFVYFDIWPAPPTAEQVAEIREVVVVAQPDARLICWAETPLEESTGETHFPGVVGMPAACTV